MKHKIFPGVLFMLCAGKFCVSLRIFSGKKDSSNVNFRGDGTGSRMDIEGNIFPIFLFSILPKTKAQNTKVYFS